MILVVGSSNIDLVASVDRLPSRGETVLGYRFAQSFGGKGANQAVAAARAGAEVAFLSKLGADANGRLIEQHLAAQGLSRPILLRDAEFPTGVAMILVDHSGENQIAVVPGSNGRLTPADLRQHRELIAGARVLLLQMEIPRETVFEALRLGRECGLTTILNPAPAAPLPSDLLRLIDILTPNESEAQALTGSADPAEAARMLTDRGVGTVVVTCGANGAFLTTGNDVTISPAFLSRRLIRRAPEMRLTVLWPVLWLKGYRSRARSSGPMRPVRWPPPDVGRRSRCRPKMTSSSYVDPGSGRWNRGSVRKSVGLISGEWEKRAAQLPLAAWARNWDSTCRASGMKSAR